MADGLAAATLAYDRHGSTTKVGDQVWSYPHIHGDTDAAPRPSSSRPMAPIRSEVVTPHGLVLHGGGTLCVCAIVCIAGGAGTDGWSVGGGAGPEIVAAVQFGLETPGKPSGWTVSRSCTASVLAVGVYGEVGVGSTSNWFAGEGCASREVGSQWEPNVLAGLLGLTKSHSWSPHRLTASATASAFRKP